VPAINAELTRGAVCPFCSLLCDDLVVAREGQALHVRKNGCPRALRGFGRLDRRIEPHVHGKPVSFEDAVARAATILRHASQPLIAGMAADVAGCRAAIALAEACGAAMDHVHGEAALRNLRVLQSRGWMQTTLAEVKNRADVLLLVGTTAAENYPRFFERFVWNRDSLSGTARKRRTILFLGEAGRLPRRGRVDAIRCANAHIPEALALLRAAIHGRPPRPDRQLTPRRLAAAERFGKVLKAARYGVIAWAPAELDPDNADLVVRALCDMVVDLNAHTRFSGLSLAGNDGGATFQNVSAWQSGFPLRVGYAGGDPVYEPLLHGSATMLRHGAADAVLWLNSLNPDLRPPAGGVPTIAVARPSRRLAHDAEVYIPVATPGLDHAGTLFRTDGVVSLPLRPLRRAVAPSAAEILGAILEQL
jgi:formylmethanofuran dehydrogenase subunit B